MHKYYLIITIFLLIILLFFIFKYKKENHTIFNDIADVVLPKFLGEAKHIINMPRIETSCSKYPKSQCGTIRKGCMWNNNKCVNNPNS